MEEKEFGSTLPPKQEAPTFLDMLKLHVEQCRKNLADAEEAVAAMEATPGAEKLLKLLKIGYRGNQ